MTRISILLLFHSTMMAEFEKWIIGPCEQASTILKDASPAVSNVVYQLIVNRNLYRCLMNRECRFGVSEYIILENIIGGGENSLSSKMDASGNLRDDLSLRELSLLAANIRSYQQYIRNLVQPLLQPTRKTFRVYRGLSGVRLPRINQILNSVLPTSWTTSFKIAEEFAGSVTSTVATPATTTSTAVIVDKFILCAVVEYSSPIIYLSSPPILSTSKNQLLMKRLSTLDCDSSGINEAQQEVLVPPTQMVVRSIIPAAESAPLVYVKLSDINDFSRIMSRCDEVLSRIERRFSFQIELEPYKFEDEV